MATIYKRGKSWHVQYREEGRLVQRSLKTHSKRLAEQKLAEIRLNLDRGQLGLGRRLNSSADAFSAFQSEVIDKKSPPWRLRMEQLIRPFRTWVLEGDGAPVTGLSTSAIESFLRDRRNEVSSKTWNEELAIIKRFFRWLKDRDFLSKDPAVTIERLPQNSRPVRIFSEDELRLVWKHATVCQRPFYQMLLYTGLRDGELRNLAWEDVDLAKRLIYVRIKEDWKPKTGRGRVVPLAKEAHELLLQLPRRGPYVFSTRNSRRWVPPRQPWVDLLERIKKAEGVDLRGQVSLHTFRHTFATVCLMNGIDIKTVSEFLGHTSVRMTEKYLHLLPEHKVAAIHRVNFSQMLR